MVALSVFVTGIAFSQGEESALEMVRKLHLGQNLGIMSYELSKATTTYQGIAANVGYQKADELLKRELESAVLQHQAQWDKNLARAWAPLMTPGELESVTSEKRESPYAAKFLSFQNQAGTTMKADSENLLITITTEALTKALEKSLDQK